MCIAYCALFKYFDSNIISKKIYLVFITTNYSILFMQYEYYTNFTVRSPLIKYIQTYIQFNFDFIKDLFNENYTIDFFLLGGVTYLIFYKVKY